MICVKTRMRIKPERCTQCTLYAKGKDFGEPCCKANGDLRLFDGFRPSSGRPKWCPLREACVCLGERE